MSEAKLGMIVAHPCETCREMVQCVAAEDGGVKHIEVDNYPEPHKCPPKHADTCPTK